MNLTNLKLVGVYLEGLEPFVYNDKDGKRVKLPEGNLSIGIGHNLESKPLSQKIIDEIFEEDVYEIKYGLIRNLPFWNELNEARQAAILFTAFQIGVHGFLKFENTIKDLSEKKYESASNDLKDSDAGRKYPKRYQLLSQMLSTGEWPNV